MNLATSRCFMVGGAVRSKLELWVYVKIQWIVDNLYEIWDLNPSPKWGNKNLFMNRFLDKYCWWFRNPVNSPVDMVNISHYLKGFHHVSYIQTVVGKGISEPSTHMTVFQVYNLMSTSDRGFDHLINQGTWRMSRFAYISDWKWWIFQPVGANTS